MEQKLVKECCSDKDRSKDDAVPPGEGEIVLFEVNKSHQRTVASPNVSISEMSTQVLKETGNKAQITITHEQNILTPDEIERMLKDAEKFAEDDNSLSERVEGNQIEIEYDQKFGAKFSDEEKAKIEEVFGGERPVSAPFEAERPVSAPFEAERPVSAPFEAERPVSAPFEAERPVNAPFEAELPMTKDNHLVGKFDLTAIHPEPRDIPQIEPTLEIDANRILQASAEASTGKERILNKDIETMKLRLEPAEKTKIGMVWHKWLLPDKYTNEEYGEMYRTLSGDTLEPLAVELIHCVSFTALIFVPRKRASSMGTTIKVYRRGRLAREEEGILPNYLNFLSGIVDISARPVFYFDEEPVKAIKEELTAKCISFLKQMSTDTCELYNNFKKNIYEGMQNDPANRRDLAQLLRLPSSKSDGLTSLECYVSRMKPKEHYIYYLSGDKDCVEILNPEMANDVEVVYIEQRDNWIDHFMHDFKGKLLVNANSGDYEVCCRLESQRALDAEAKSKAKGAATPKVKKAPSSVLRVSNISPPFTNQQLQQLLGCVRGRLTEGGLWVAKDQSGCIAVYQSVEEAVATKEALHGRRWPETNQKQMRVGYISQQELDDQLDAEEARKVSAENMSTGKSEKMTVTNDENRQTQGDIEGMIKDAEMFADEDKLVDEQLEARNELECVYSKEKLGSLLSDDEKTKIEEDWYPGETQQIEEPAISEIEDFDILPTSSPKEVGDAEMKDISQANLMARRKSIRSDPPLSPASAPLSSVLSVMNLTRPFRVTELKELLGRTGQIVEGGFWIDNVKSRCLVEFTSEEEAAATKDALHGVKWPGSNPKLLSVDYSTKDNLENHLHV